MPTSVFAFAHEACQSGLRVLRPSEAIVQKYVSIARSEDIFRLAALAMKAGSEPIYTLDHGETSTGSPTIANPNHFKLAFEAVPKVT